MLRRELLILITYELASEYCSRGFPNFFLVFRVEKHDVDFPEENSNAGEVSCPKKWILKPDLEYFDTPLESHSQDFVEHKISRCLCKALIGAQTTELKLSGLERHLIGEGSHRRLSSSIRMNVCDEFVVNHPAYSCEVIVIEKLPHGIFTNPFESQHLFQHGSKLLLVPSGRTHS